MLASINLPPQFQAIKGDDEEYIWVGTPQFFPFISTGFPFLLLSLVYIVGTYPYARKKLWLYWHDSQVGFILMYTELFFLLFLAILNIFRLIFIYKDIHYAVTNKRIMMMSGFWGTNFYAIGFDKILDVQVTSNLLENKLGVGTITILSGNYPDRGTSLTEKFIGIKNSQEVFKK